jgi:hypothetical protein
MEAAPGSGARNRCPTKQALRLLGVERIFEYYEVDAHENRLTVEVKGRTMTYDPKRLHGVNVFEREERAIAVGDRVRFTQPYSERRLANGETGTVTGITRQELRVRLDDTKKGEGKGRSVALDVKEFPHIEYGYVTTSYASQSRTTSRVLFHVDTDRGGANLNDRTTYVGPTRGREDIRVYTNDEERMVRNLSREMSHRSALEQIPAQRKPSGLSCWAGRKAPVAPCQVPRTAIESRRNRRPPSGLLVPYEDGAMVPTY